MDIYRKDTSYNETQYYSELKGPAYATAVYAGCRVYEKILNASEDRPEIRKAIRAEIKPHIAEFLKFGRSRKVTKIFATGIVYFPNLLSTMYKLVSHLRRDS